MSDTLPPLPLRLNNLYSKSPSLAKLAATVSEDDHAYIIRGVLAGEHGAMQAILSHFWLKFTAEVRDNLKLPAYWNPDNKNPERIAEILSRMNFYDRTTVPAPVQSRGQRRSNPRTPKPKKQPAPRDGNKRTARSNRSKVPNASSSTESAEGNGNFQSDTEATSEETFGLQGTSVA